MKQQKLVEGMVTKILRIELDKNKNKIFGIRSAILWGFIKDNVSCPIAYLRKPKYMSDEEFENILDKLEIKIKKMIF